MTDGRAAAGMLKVVYVLGYRNSIPDEVGRRDSGQAVVDRLQAAKPADLLLLWQRWNVALPVWNHPKLMRDWLSGGA